MPDNTQDQNPNDLLEQLLVVAAEKAAKNEAEEALKKGYVTREQINMAFDAFGNKLQSELTDNLLGKIESMIQQTVERSIESNETLQKGRKSTVSSPEKEREDDPIAFLLKKGHDALSADRDPDFDQVDKEVIWAITERALSAGMTFDTRDE